MRRPTIRGCARKMTTIGGFVLVAMVLASVPAYAEGANASILIPKLAEFVPALISFLILWFVLAKLAWPRILGALDAREAKIKGDIEAAEQAHIQAAEELEKSHKLVIEAQRQANEILAQAKHNCDAERAEIIAKAQADAASILTKAKEAVESEREKIRHELAESVVDLAVEIAGKMIGDDSSVEDQRKLAEKYLTEVGNLHDE